MDKETPPDETVKILPPDYTLRKKVGNADLGRLLSPQIVAAAQQVITQSADQFFDECVTDVQKLERGIQDIGSAPDKTEQILHEMSAVTFSLRTKAGIGGYDLVSVLAKSLHQHCTQTGDSALTPTQLRIMQWHVESLVQLLKLKVKGLGGAVGDAILAELDRLGIHTDQPKQQDQD